MAYEVSGHTLGATAMCVLAFLDAGVSKDDSSLIRGVQALRQYPAGNNIRDTYPIAVQTIALIRYGDPSDRPLLETTNFSGCRGYSPNSAMQLAVNFLLYSLTPY
jgi:hypothetical protein